MHEKFGKMRETSAEAISELASVETELAAIFKKYELHGLVAIAITEVAEDSGMAITGIIDGCPLHTLFALAHAMVEKLTPEQMRGFSSVLMFALAEKQRKLAGDEAPGPQGVIQEARSIGEALKSLSEEEKKLLLERPTSPWKN